MSLDAPTARPYASIAGLGLTPSALLREAARQPVLCAEAPGARHALDSFHWARCACAVGAVRRFPEPVGDRIVPGWASAASGAAAPEARAV